MSFILDSDVQGGDSNDFVKFEVLDDLLSRLGDAGLISADAKLDWQVALGGRG